jgi:hypothetical protein
MSSEDYSGATVATLAGVGGHLRSGDEGGRGDQDSEDGGDGRHVGVNW